MSTYRGDKFGFSNFVEREIKRQRLDLDRGATNLLMDVIASGAQTLAKEKDQDRNIAEATRNLHLLITKLAMEADGKTVNERMLKDVMAGICPIWPFC